MRHYQESELEFRSEKEESSYPVVRGIIVHQFGGDLEECIQEARKRFNLDSNWKLVRSECENF